MIVIAFIAFDGSERLTNRDDLRLFVAILRTPARSLLVFSHANPEY